jgi:predicted nucleic acid-binding protein
MSKQQSIVSDTGPLITLEMLTDGYRFIELLYSQIIIPQSVLDEVAKADFATTQSYLTHHQIKDLVSVQQPDTQINVESDNRLHDGELHAIQLAIQLQLPLLIEETLGRKIAQQAGIPISGIAGQILKAHRQRLVTKKEASQKILELFRIGRINRRIYEVLIGELASRK